MQIDAEGDEREAKHADTEDFSGVANLQQAVCVFIKIAFVGEEDKDKHVLKGELKRGEVGRLQVIVAYLSVGENAERGSDLDGEGVEEDGQCKGEHAGDRGTPHFFDVGEREINLRLFQLVHGSPHFRDIVYL